MVPRPAEDFDAPGNIEARGRPLAIRKLRVSSNTRSSPTLASSDRESPKWWPPIAQPEA